jgi:hypothetical protein
MEGVKATASRQNIKIGKTPNKKQKNIYIQKISAMI